MAKHNYPKISKTPMEEFKVHIKKEEELLIQEEVVLEVKSKGKI